jgi:hypothetical protein
LQSPQTAPATTRRGGRRGASASTSTKARRPEPEADSAVDQLHDLAVRTGLGETEVRKAIESGYATGLAGIAGRVSA